MADDLSVTRPVSPPSRDNDGGRRPPARGKRPAAPPRPAAEPAAAVEPPTDAPDERRLDLLV